MFLKLFCILLLTDFVNLFKTNIMFFIQKANCFRVRIRGEGVSQSFFLSLPYRYKKKILKFPQVIVFIRLLENPKKEIKIYYNKIFFLNDIFWRNTSRY